MSINYAKTIEEKGIRPSIQRTVIYEYVCTHKIHPTVDDVYTALSPLYSTLSRTTVYNTLKLFSEKALVQIVKIEDDELRYDAEIKPHLHFKCEKCHKVYDIFDDEKIVSFNNMCNKLMPTGFMLNTIQTNLWGICSSCSNQK